MIFRRKKLKISRLSGWTSSFLFLNVTGPHIKAFVVVHDDKRLLVDVDVTPDGGNITIMTDDNWALDTEAWLVHDDEVPTVRGLAQPSEPFTYIVRHR